MQNPTTLLKAYGEDDERSFTFDYSFWSFDQYEEDGEGYLKPTSDSYADQDYVYKALGTSIIEDAWKGYHCCLFAYGQTGSGKSYSMIGYGKNQVINFLISGNCSYYL